MLAPCAKRPSSFDSRGSVNTEMPPRQFCGHAADQACERNAVAAKRAENNVRMSLTLITPPPPAFGQAGRDFCCDGVPAAPSEAELVKLLWRRWPNPPPSPYHVHFLGKKSDVPGIWADPGAARFLYYSLTQGYGPFSEMAATWLVNKKTPTSAECVDLVRHCEARLRNLDALYTVAAFAGTGTQLLAPREIYSLIEPSEKANASFALGSALAASVAHQCFAGRGHGALYRIYHLRLVNSADFCAKHVTVKSAGKTPDYIAFVAEPVAGLLVPHIIECKGGASVNYTEVAHGIIQAQAVDAIAGVPPETRNVSVTTHWTPPKQRSLVLTHMLWVRHPTASDRARAEQGAEKRPKKRKSADPLLLDGMYMVSMSCFFAGLVNGNPGANGFFHYQSKAGVQFAVDRRAHQALRGVWERLLTLKPARNQLGRFLRETGREMYALRQLEAAPGDGAEGWTPVEGYWLWMRTGPVGFGAHNDGGQRRG